MYFFNINRNFIKGLCIIRNSNRYTCALKRRKCYLIAGIELTYNRSANPIGNIRYFQTSNPYFLMILNILMLFESDVMFTR